MGFIALLVETLWLGNEWPPQPSLPHFCKQANLCCLATDDARNNNILSRSSQMTCYCAGTSCDALAFCGTRRVCSSVGNTRRWG